jgi:hypothetical protein
MNIADSTDGSGSGTERVSAYFVTSELREAVYFFCRVSSAEY